MRRLRRGSLHGATFTDVPTSFWAYGDIESLSGLGYISGYPDGSFKPGNTITRAEFVSILAKVLKLATYNPAAPDFSDVAQGDWFYGSVEEAVYAGIVKGYGSTFKPDDPITREEMAVILVNALNEQDQAKSSMNPERPLRTMPASPPGRGGSWRWPSRTA